MMDKLPEVTIIVPVRNMRDTVRKCVESLLKLDYPDDRCRIIIVDGFSVDGTWEILQEYGGRVDLFQHEGHAAVTTNYAISLVETPITCFTDADVIVDRKWVSELVLNMGEYKASAGFCATPDGSGRFQKLVGRELEDRFKCFGEVIVRAPTMNLCVQSEALREFMFDERLAVAYDTDFGYRFSGKYGGIKYVPSAVVYHHHRSDWNGFFRQQCKTAEYMPYLYLKHFNRSGGDHISKGGMIIQPFLMVSGLVLASAGFLHPFLFKIGVVFLGAESLIVLYDSARLSGSISDFPYYVGIFTVRVIAWCLGLLKGVLRLPSTIAVLYSAGRF
ncbi:MAG: glycosyltransferase [Candidatus Altiarchaeota archaeon]